MTEEVLGSIHLQSEPTLQNYMKNLNGESMPIFLIGQSIGGSVEIAPRKKLKLKGVFIKIIAKYYHNNAVVKTHLIEQQQLINDSIIKSSTQCPFEFVNLNISYPSYHGFQSSLIYQIVLVIKKRFSESLVSKDFIFISPITIEQNLVRPLVISGKTNFIEFELFSQSNIIYSDDMIKGEFRMKQNRSSLFTSIVLKLFAKERLRVTSEPIISENLVLSYQIVDGNLKSSKIIPFIIPLSPLKLWTTKHTQGILMDVSFHLDVYIYNGNQQKLIGSSPIQLNLKKTVC